MKEIMNTKTAVMLTMALLLVLLVLVPIVKADVTVIPGGVVHVDANAIAEVGSDAADTLAANIQADPTKPKQMQVISSALDGTKTSTRIEACAKINAEGKTVYPKAKWGSWQPSSPDEEYQHCYPTLPTSVHVTSTNPVDGAIVSDQDVIVTATFSGQLLPSSVNAGSFTLKVGNANGAQVPAIVSYDASTKTASINPVAPLEDGIYYANAIGAPGGLRDANNVPIEGYAWSFTVSHCDNNQVTLPGGTCIP